jgi:peptidoglycan/xylan/chitin deacetylase (PgdA/CDA1 family)
MFSFSSMESRFPDHGRWYRNLAGKDIPVSRGRQSAGGRGFSRSSRARKILREFIAYLYYFSGVHSLLLKLHDRRKATILVYHDPLPEVLRAHLEYLSGTFTFIPLGTLVKAIRCKDWSTIPSNALVLAFDDGHKGNHALLDLFKTFRVQPTLSLCSHIVNTRRHYWWKNDAVEVRKLKRLPFEEMRDLLEREAGFNLRREYPDRQGLNLSELQEMAPYVEFGSHTRFHPVLTNCDDGQCFLELADSQAALEALLNRPIEHIAYPNGDYRTREIQYAKKCGYTSARTLDIGRNGIDADPYGLKAVAIGDDASINILRAQLTGFFGYIKYARYGSFRGLRPSFL